MHKLIIAGAFLLSACATTDLIPQQQKLILPSNLTVRPTNLKPITLPVASPSPGTSK